LGDVLCGSVLTHAPVVLLAAEEAVDEDDGRSILGRTFGRLVEVVGERYAVG